MQIFVTVLVQSDLNMIKLNKNVANQFLSLFKSYHTSEYVQVTQSYLCLWSLERQEILHVIKYFMFIKHIQNKVIMKMRLNYFF